MTEPRYRDEEVAERLLGVLQEDDPEAPANLPDRTIQKVQALMTSRDIIDLATVVFVLRFCAPLIDLIAAMLGQDLPAAHRRPEKE
jgi:hypothetical protein